MNYCNNKNKFFSLSLLVLYLVIIIYITLLSRDAYFSRSCKLELFWSYIAWLDGQGDYTIQILSNIVLFIPYGFFLANAIISRQVDYSGNNVKRNHKTLWLPVLISFATSITIEIIQYFFGLGYCDVDDVISNVLGGLAGAYIYGLCVLRGTAETANKHKKALSALFIMAGLIGCMMSSSVQSYVPVKRLGYAVRDVYLNAVSAYSGPEVKNTDLITVVNKGMLKAYESDYDVYVYQYDHKLYWLIGSPIDKKTEIIFHLLTDEPDKLPAHRIKYRFDNRGFRAGAKNEITDTMKTGKYRVFVREIPVEYHITEIRVGFNTGGKITWTQSFLLSE